MLIMAANRCMQNLSYCQFFDFQQVEHCTSNQNRRGSNNDDDDDNFILKA
jgi:hypothetical protein